MLLSAGLIGLAVGVIQKGIIAVMIKGVPGTESGSVREVTGTIAATELAVVIGGVVVQGTDDSLGIYNLLYI